MSGLNLPTPGGGGGGGGSDDSSSDDDRDRDVEEDQDDGSSSSSSRTTSPTSGSGNVAPSEPDEADSDDSSDVDRSGSSETTSPTSGSGNVEPSEPEEDDIEEDEPVDTRSQDTVTPTRDTGVESGEPSTDEADPDATRQSDLEDETQRFFRGRTSGQFSGDRDRPEFEEADDRVPMSSFETEERGQIEQQREMFADDLDRFGADDIIVREVDDGLVFDIESDARQREFDRELEAIESSIGDGLEDDEFAIVFDESEGEFDLLVDDFAVDQRQQAELRDEIGDETGVEQRFIAVEDRGDSLAAFVDPDRFDTLDEESATGFQTEEQRNLDRVLGGVGLDRPIPEADGFDDTRTDEQRFIDAQTGDAFSQARDIEEDTILGDRDGREERFLQSISDSATGLGSVPAALAREIDRTTVEIDASFDAEITDRDVATAGAIGGAVAAPEPVSTTTGAIAGGVLAGAALIDRTEIELDIQREDRQAEIPAPTAIEEAQPSEIESPSAADRSTAEIESPQAREDFETTEIEVERQETQSAIGEQPLQLGFATQQVELEITEDQDVDLGQVSRGTATELIEDSLREQDADLLEQDREPTADEIERSLQEFERELEQADRQQQESSREQTTRQDEIEDVSQQQDTTVGQQRSVDVSQEQSVEVGLGVGAGVEAQQGLQAERSLQAQQQIERQQLDQLEQSTQLDAIEASVPAFASPPGLGFERANANVSGTGPGRRGRRQPRRPPMPSAEPIETEFDSTQGGFDFETETVEFETVGLDDVEQQFGDVDVDQDFDLDFGDL